MKVVIDTNCFLSCVGKLSEYRNVFDAFLDSKFELCLSTEILFEYEEMFHTFWGESVTHNLLGVLLTAENTSLHDVFYNFRLVQGDLDDNKFVDTFLASNSDILISNDKKILALNELEFPPVFVIRLENFSKMLKEEKQ